MADNTRIKEARQMSAAARRALATTGAVLATVVALAGVFTGSAGAEAQIKKFILTRTSAQAGGHPDMYAKLEFTTKNEEINEAQNGIGKEINDCLCTDPRQFTIHFPTGVIGNPHTIPQCTLAQLGLKKCPPDSQVGLSSALFGEQFIYNMEPRPGEPGLLATQIPALQTPVFTILRGRTDSDYGLDATTPDIFHLLGLSTIQLWIWGVPTDHVHDIYRAPLGEQGGCGKNYPEPCFTKPTLASAPAAPYLQNPTKCAESLTASVNALYYNGETVHAEVPWSETTGCDLLAFNPSLVANPTTDQADSPSGMDIIAKVPQTQSPTVPSASEIKSIRVTMPEGMSINPNAADGKQACTDAEGAIGTLEGAQCPQSSKIGILTLDSSALPGPISGAMYLAEPEPGQRYRVLFAADGYETHIKLIGIVEPDPATGRITVRFDDLPQSPLQEFDLHLFGAERGLLAMPERCGSYTVESEFSPWAEVLGSQIVSTEFTVDSGPNGSPCPGASRPLAPTLVGGSPDNSAGAHSSLAVKIDRRDGDQNLSQVKVITPPGFLASLRGVPYCSEAALQSLSGSTHSGRDEQASSACPDSSRVGVVTTATGAGSAPLYTPGGVYLSGPYKGAPISLVAVVPAVSGPYDLGNVAVRIATYIDPVTAQVTTSSDPLPQILDGIPLRMRTVVVNLNRPNFGINPTNCSPFSIDSTVFGDESGLANNSAFYQVANCAALSFAPKLQIDLRGSTKRRGHPSVHAILEAQPGESNLASTTVTLPKALQLDNGHIKTICTRAQFAAETCPAGSMLGRATAVTPLLDAPISGPVYLRSSSHKLPDLVADLRGQIDIEVSAQIDSPKSGGLRTRFATIPDAPVSKFVLDLEGKRKGLLISSVPLCKELGKVEMTMVGQNGMRSTSRRKLGTSCGSAAKRSKHRHLFNPGAVR